MTSPTPPVPPGVPQAAAVQQVAQEVARKAVAQTDELRALAMEIGQQVKPEFKASTFRKGIITAVNDNATPPTVSLQLSGDTATTISGVRRLEGYSPVVNQTALVLKQGSEIMALGHIATQPESPWTQVSLNSGFSHDGNSNGNLEYRKVIDHGSEKIQWRGGVNRNSGNVLCTLPTGFRPSSRRTLLTARTAVGGSNDVKVDFNTNGTVELVGLQTAPNLFTSGNSTDSRTYDHPAHSHGGATGGGQSISTTDFANFVHSHNLNLSVTNSVSEPSWISFNGLEYFL